MKKVVKNKENVKSDKPKKKNNKKIILLVFIIVLSLLITAASVVVVILFRKEDISFTLKGNENVTIEVGSEYTEEGYSLVVDKKTKKASIEGKVDTTKIGNYDIHYVYIGNRKRRYEKIRNVLVVDTTSPTITITGKEVLYYYVGAKYKELGYSASDNYDGDITDKVEVTNNIDNTKVGSYEVVYTVKDSSQNEFTLKRVVNIIEKKIITTTESKGTAESTTVNNLINKYNNTIVENKFNNNSVYLKGYLKNNNGSLTLRANGSESYDFDMTIKDGIYSGNLDFSKLENGNYDLYVVSGDEARVQNKMDKISRIVRSKVGDKLITFNYNNDLVSVSVENFNYQYDILIDVGHGGSDVGASNGLVYEKDMNLTVSKYEKCRYEEHGLKVYLSRENDTYGLMMGDSSWKDLTRHAYALGYYGAVSKIVYSNHHNSTTNDKKRGYEIITPTQYDSLDTEKAIASRFNEYYDLSSSTSRFYTRNYHGGEIKTTLNNNKYDFKIYYAVVRVPYELYNTKLIIYEPIFISNYNDYSWYWLNGKWKEVSEIKISEYVKSLGITYNESTSC